MTTEEFERLKAICEKEGFTIESYCGGKTAIVGVKDIWEGVEFAESLWGYKIYKISEVKNFEIDKANFKPSTESAYVEQLKKEAFERFGEIKKGDRFINTHGGKDTLVKDPLWRYNKEYDWLYYGQCKLYEKGQWAERVKKRIKVQFSNHSACGNSDFHTHGFALNVIRGGDQFDHEKAGQFLAKQLEAYLNNEI